ncbi:MAG: glycoside hydrolase family 3 C-terminal domain-containing protein [Acidobacteriota bacterium]|nr:glycoside hydrolase family 3 C-terminal domain-containing protein [Acidobacteriota bacterium]
MQNKLTAGLKRAICLSLFVLVSRALCPAQAQAPTPEQRADAIVKQMTLDEKIAQIHGVATPEHFRWVEGVPRLGVPPLPMANGPAGIGPADRVQPHATAFPAPIAVAASWDRDDAREYGVVVADEFQDIGRKMLEGPTVNIARIPVAGRTFEAYGEDPFLSGEIAVANIDGIQSRHVIANVKHFALNNQELNRTSVNAIADERTMREIYFPAFEAAIRTAHSGSVMCSYNKVNGDYACQNKFLLTDVLRNDWHFDGFVVSDFGAAHDGPADAAAGLDLEMPTGRTYNAAFAAQVRDGTIPVSTIDAFLRHRYATMIRLGLFDEPATMSPIPEQADGAIAERLAEHGIVLLRNQKNILPLDPSGTGSIAVIGPDADSLMEGGGAAYVLALHTINPLQAMRTRFGSNRIQFVPVGGPGFIDPRDTIDGSALAPPHATSGQHGVLAEYFDNTTLSGKPMITRTVRIPETLSEFGGPIPGLTSNFSLRWTADLTPPATGDYTLGTEIWGKMRLYLDGKLLIDQTQKQSPFTPGTATVHLEAGRAYALRAEYISEGRGIARVFWQLPAGIDPPGIAQAVDAAQHASVAIVFAGAWAHEGWDRASLALPGAQDSLIEAVAKANPNTIVVLQTGEPVLMPWINDVAAVVEAWFPGEEGGTAIARVLAGDVNPSGKLPITFPPSDAELPASTPDQYPGIHGVEHYSEGLKVGYRWFDAEQKTPLFPFGFGLSYTQFAFSNLAVSPQPDGSVAVHVTVANTGTRPGAEVAQIYVGYPKETGEPPLQLRGFSKVQLQPGESKQLEFNLEPRAFSYWSVADHGWKVAPGSYSISAGSSSRDLPLHAQIAR